MGETYVILQGTAQRVADALEQQADATQLSEQAVQRYLFKVGPVDLPDRPLRPGIVNFFKEGLHDEPEGICRSLDPDGNLRRSQ